MSAEQFTISGEQFNISAEQINMDVDQFNMDTKHYSSGSSREQVSSGSIEQFSSSEQFISGSEQVSSGREQFNSGSEQASSGREQVSSGREKVSSDSGSGQEQLSNGTFSCEVCLVVMTNLRSLTKHVCPIKIIKDRSAHLRVLDNASNTSMAQILLNCNTPRQISSICEAGGFCMKGGYPYLFPRQNQKLPILNSIGVTGTAAHKQLKAAVSEGPVVLK